MLSKTLAHTPKLCYETPLQAFAAKRQVRLDRAPDPGPSQGAYSQAVLLKSLVLVQAFDMTRTQCWRCLSRGGAYFTEELAAWGAHSFIDGAEGLRPRPLRALLGGIAGSG
jgi:hypothetical protein